MRRISLFAACLGIFAATSIATAQTPADTTTGLPTRIVEIGDGLPPHQIECSGTTSEPVVFDCVVTNAAALAPTLAISETEGVSVEGLSRLASGASRSRIEVFLGAGETDLSGVLSELSRVFDDLGDGISLRVNGDAVALDQAARTASLEEVVASGIEALDAASAPDVVVVVFGAEDAWSEASMEALRTNLEPLHTRLILLPVVADETVAPDALGGLQDLPGALVFEGMADGLSDVQVALLARAATPSFVVALSGTPAEGADAQIALEYEELGARLVFVAQTDGMAGAGVEEPSALADPMARNALIGAGALALVAVLALVMRRARRRTPEPAKASEGVEETGQTRVVEAPVGAATQIVGAETQVLAEATHLVQAELETTDGTRIAIPPGRTVLGRAMAGPVPDALAQPFISREHAAVRHEGVTMVLENLTLSDGSGSSRPNPVFVNGTEINAPVRLQPGDVIKLGDEGNVELTVWF